MIQEHYFGWLLRCYYNYTCAGEWAVSKTLRKHPSMVPMKGWLNVVLGYTLAKAIVAQRKTIVFRLKLNILKYSAICAGKVSVSICAQACWIWTAVSSVQVYQSIKTYPNSKMKKQWIHIFFWKYIKIVVHTHFYTHLNSSNAGTTYEQNTATWP